MSQVSHSHLVFVHGVSVKGSESKCSKTVNLQKHTSTVSCVTSSFATSPSPMRSVFIVKFMSSVKHEANAKPHLTLFNFKEDAACLHFSFG